MSQIVLIPCVLSILFLTGQAVAGDTAPDKRPHAIPLPEIKAVIPSIDDAPGLIVINHEIINQQTDLYEPSIFMHGKHANLLVDCTVCHHRISSPDAGPDGIPVTLAQLQELKHMPENCATCHGNPFQSGNLEKPGLKGALHRRCMNCHEEAGDISFSRGPMAYRPMVIGAVARNLNTQAPTDCRSCHTKKVPDHSKLVKLEENTDALKVTQACLSCHEKQGEAVLKSVHWKWQGPSPYTLGHEKDIDMGKHHRAFNNFCLNLNGNWPDCTGCHIGYGWRDPSFDFNDPSKIDCLVCHDRTEWNEYVKTDAGWPVADVDLHLVAKSVGHPNRSNCGSACHFFGGHGDATKHGALSSALAEMDSPSRDLDVHMGGESNFSCQYCHKTKNHMITGRTVSSSATEGDISCEYCHTDQPHRKTGITSHHLNKHGRHVACQTCHIPLFSKAKKTQVGWDWSTAGEHSANHHGTKIKQQAGKPIYLWYNETVKRYVMGDRINENGVTNLTTIQGNINDPDAKIFPFKAHRGKQISDKINKYLLPAQLWSGFAKHWDWDQAIRYAVKSTDLAYSGEYEFVETVMYFPLTHEVVPKEKALSCVTCHAAFTKTDCSRCHQPREGVDFSQLVKKGIDFKQMADNRLPVQSLIGATDYIDFKALGYPGDPVTTGVCRLQKLPLVDR